MEQLTTAYADISIADGIGTLTITRCGPLNLLGSPAIQDLTKAIRDLADNPGVRVMVLRGTGDRAFVGGADINEMAQLTRDSGEQFISGLRKLCDSVRHFPAPVIARMPGWCLGGGLELAIACDIRIASESVRLGMPEVKVGIPSVIHAALLPKLIGHARTAWLLLTGEPVSASEALEWGLVNKIVEPAQLDQEIDHLARMLARLGPAVLRQQKRLMRSWEDQTVDVSIAASITEFGKAFETGEPGHYMNAFLERKKP